ncbi:2,3-diketo-L-gulonate TRAP transporter small permease protein YiaM [Rhodobacteraceae bacterium THAF1]|uniref:TRAP transporter small permease subunit n=1 Tax=Palleronia sp. THAF1 TaxID=2587842 RepID=UPI000F3F6186|nr:TRAP transporter small permease subunit [Palleronia sp. THAF1]QFU09691.1 2,3-diketo-L-gulonate TRAP transporter small permease protein YiaM [Palleronia sp. THAF1]VDC17406.1 2,3-diketo-L-gulonate TRAP transporter small permease protein YiaM [Rhodobacteraceae bacterium THAF1]
MGSIIKIIDTVNEIVGRIVVVLAAVFAAIIIYDVVMRYVFNAPTRWAFDLSKQLYGFYFILLGGYALRNNAHVRVDLLIERFSDGWTRIVEVLGYVIFFFPFTWIFLTRSYDFAATSWAQGETTYGAVALPIYPLKAALCVASGLLLIQGVSQVLKILFDHREEQEIHQ